MLGIQSQRICGYYANFASSDQLTEGLLLFPQLLELSHHLLRTLQILSKWLFNDDSVVSLVGVAVLLEACCYDGEDVGWKGHVEEPVGLLDSCIRLELLHLFVEICECLILIVSARCVSAELEELVLALL